jgi:hypothetical protein
VNGPEALLHVFGGKNIGDASELVKEVVFEAEHRGRANNGRLGIDVADNFLTPRLYNC